MSSVRPLTTLASIAFCAAFFSSDMPLRFGSSAKNSDSDFSFFFLSLDAEREDLSRLRSLDVERFRRDLDLSLRLRDRERRLPPREREPCRLEPLLFRDLEREPRLREREPPLLRRDFERERLPLRRVRDRDLDFDLDLERALFLDRERPRFEGGSLPPWKPEAMMGLLKPVALTRASARAGVVAASGELSMEIAAAAPCNALLLPSGPSVRDSCGGWVYGDW
mmetsp:Transcript_89150/g.252636  ORF Transcript_89150/g.252636 Transcript_89150/m.252636 type:complete len:223 (+) Transcript_89150:124-792(+)